MLRPKNGWKKTKGLQPGPLRGIGEWNAPGASHEFPPWVVSAYQIAVKHGFDGTEHDFRMFLLGRPGIEMMPMLLVTEEPETEIPDDYEAIMRPSSGAYAYYTQKNEFRAADEEIKVPDGLGLTGRVLKPACNGEQYGNGATLPETELPEVTAADNGKVMKVVSGAWGAGAIGHIGYAELNDQAIARFTTAVGAYPIHALSIGIDPVQDLHGYDAPWPAGGGKNLGNFIDGHGINVDGVVNDVATRCATVDPIIIDQSKSYVVSGVGVTFIYAVWNGNTLVRRLTQISSGTVLDVSDGTHLYVCAYENVAAGGMATVANNKPQVEVGTVPTSYSPYSNICPISGFESAKVRRTGKNLISPKYSSRTRNGITFTVNSDGTITTSNTATNDAYAAENLTANPSMMTLIPPGTYTLTGGISSDELVYIAGKYADGSNIPSAGYTSDSGSGRAFTLTKYAYIYPQIKIKSGTTSNRTFKIQLELGSTATAYEPYIGNTYDISWETKAGTVYGGTLDVTTGVLTVDKAIVSVADLSWTYNGTWGYMQTLALQSTILRPPSNTDVLSGLLCSAYKTGTAQQTGSGAVNGTVGVDVNGGLRIRDEAYTDADTWKTAMGAQIIVYPIATPLTYQLTGVQIFTLLGYNNIWADTGNIRRIVYPIQI